MEKSVIPTIQKPLAEKPLAGLSLAFPDGYRPLVSELSRLCNSAPFDCFPFVINDCDRSSQGCVEVLAAGLAFELTGFAPAAAEPMPQISHFYGLPAGFSLAGHQAVTLRPGAHLVGGESLLPVVRTMVGVASALTALPGLAAIIWHPACTAMAPADFVRMVAGWLLGGAFPALGLTALTPTDNGGLASEGLCFFTGQELRIEPISGMNMPTLGKIAIRLINRMVESAKVVVPCDLTGPDGELLRVEPVDEGRIVRVWKTG